MRTIERATRVLPGQTALFDLSGYPLPGEYVIRYDYIARPEDQPYPSEQFLIIGREGLSIRLSPMYPMVMDSVEIERDGGEHAAWASFQAEQQLRRAPVLSMRQWLTSETPSARSYYRKSLREYERRRTRYNAWVQSSMQAQGDRFVKRMMQYSLMPDQILGRASSGLSPAEHLSILDLQDTLLLHTRNFSDHITSFLRFVFEQVPDGLDRDSTMMAAASGLLDAASAGHPRVYGAVADQLFSLFTRIGFDAGIPIMGRHLSDPRCQSAKKEAITRKIAAMGRLQIGSRLFDIGIPDNNGRHTSLSTLMASKPQALLLFWSAGCQHCLDLIAGMKARLSGPDLMSRLQVIAVSVDEAEVYRQRWAQEIQSLPDWHHGICQEGSKSPLAKAFGVLATPTMFLIEREGFRLKGMPTDLASLQQLLYP